MSATGPARLLCLDPGADVTRRDVYSRMRERGVEVVLLNRVLRPWERGQVDRWIEGDPTDPAVALEAARRAAPLAGVLNCSESCLEAAAAVAEGLELPGPRPALARLCRDKLLMAERLPAAGVPQALRSVVTRAGELGAAAARVGFPCVLKPSTGVASIYTVRCETLGELERWFRRFSADVRAHAPAPLRRMEDRWIVEEYLDGPAFSVESLVVDGRVSHLATCRKGSVAPPFFREVGHSSPAGIDRQAERELHDLTDRTVAALEIDHCVTHAEFKVTRDGPRLLEIGARMGGGSIRQVVRLATGIDLLELTLDLALGRTPEPRPRHRGAAASRSLFPARAGRVAGLDPAALLALPGIVAVNAWMRPGDVYHLPPRGLREVLGVVACGRDPEQAIRRAESAIVNAEAAGAARLVPLEAVA